MKKSIKTSSWSTHEWLQFIRKLSHPLPIDKIKSLDNAFSLTGISNSEIADEWYKLAIASNYSEANLEMKKFLGSVGRQKFLQPLYSELIKTPEGKKMANEIFAQSKMNYHPLTALKIEKILK